MGILSGAYEVNRFPRETKEVRAWCPDLFFVFDTNKNRLGAIAGFNYCDINSRSSF